VVTLERGQFPSGAPRRPPSLRRGRTEDAETLGAGPRQPPEGRSLMGLLDRLKGLKRKAGDLAEKHDDKLDAGIDKAADFADDRTGHRYSEHIDKGEDAARDAIEKLDEK
jgi:hypothetical protein